MPQSVPARFRCQVFFSYENYVQKGPGTEADRHGRNDGLYQLNKSKLRSELNPKQHENLKEKNPQKQPSRKKTHNKMNNNNNKKNTTKTLFKKYL